MKKYLKIALPILTVLAMLFIFSNSLSVGSVAEARRDSVADVVREAVSVFTGKRTLFTSAQLKILSKLFHVAEFAMFSFFLSASLRFVGGMGREGYEKVLLCGALTALADEQLQSVVSGRNSRLADVFIDLAGIMLGYCAVYLVSLILKRRKKHE